MIRHAAITLLGAAALVLAAAPVYAESPGDTKGKLQEREARHELIKKELRQMEDVQRQEQRDLQDRHEKERKALHQKHEQERDAMRQKLAPK